MADEPRLAVESIAGQRPYQEDAVLAETLADGRTLVAVADGMGGHAAGEVASALALETLVEALTDGMDLSEAFRLANARVQAKASEPGKQGMGTTLVAVLVDGDQYRIANVGDSRGYVISSQGIRQLTEDHSFVAEAMKRGQTEDEAMATPWKDALTRSIGTEEDVEVDVFGPYPLQRDSALLLCSDGLYKTLTDEDLEELFQQSGGARGAAQSMVTAAFDNGSDDNISVAIAEYGEVPRETAPSTMVLSYEVEEAEGDDSPTGESGSAPETLTGMPALEGDTGDVPAEPAASGGLPVAALLGALAVIVAVAVAILVLLG